MVSFGVAEIEVTVFLGHGVPREVVKAVLE